METSLHPSPHAPGLLLGEGVDLPDDIELGGNVVIHAGTSFRSDVVVQDAAVIGKVPKLRPGSSARDATGERCVIDAGAAVLTGAVVFAGARIGAGAIVGDHARVRERAAIGANSLVGAATTIDNDVMVGSNVSIQTNCYVTAYSEIEDDVFVGPGVVTTNDDTMSRHPPAAKLDGAVLRRACRIGGGVVICPGVAIGEEAFVAAGAVVTRDVPSRAVVMGNPARQVREVPAADLLERWR